MRKHLALIGLLLATGCGKPMESESSGPAERDSSEPMGLPRVVFEPSAETVAPPGASRDGGPNIGITAAPGVAFNYRYAFRLPSERIAAVQERHAQACEKLGIARCRIVGMRYRLENERDISAMLAFKLDPAIARNFGKLGVAEVTQAEGMLVDSEISGVDAGSAISVANQNDARIADELARIEARLATKLSPEERTRLTDEATQLRQQRRANADNKRDQQESLTTTPMVFNYGSGNLIPGFDTRSPLRGAFAKAGDFSINTLAFLIVLLGAIAPWAIIAGLGWLGVRRFLPRRERTIAAPAETA